MSDNGNEKIIILDNDSDKMTILVKGEKYYVFHGAKFEATLYHEVSHIHEDHAFALRTGSSAGSLANMFFKSSAKNFPGMLILGDLKMKAWRRAAKLEMKFR